MDNHFLLCTNTARFGLKWSFEASYKAFSWCSTPLSYRITEEITWKHVNGNCRLLSPQSSAFLHIISLLFIILFPFFPNQKSLYDSSEVRPHWRSSHSLTVRNVPAVTRGDFACYLRQKRSGNKIIGPLVSPLIMTDECRRAVRTCWGSNIYIQNKYMCVSSLQNTPGSFLFLHKIIFINVTVDSYSLHNLKLIALLWIQHLWHYQATQIYRNFQSYLEFSGVLLSYVMLTAFLLENIFLD